MAGRVSLLNLFSALVAIDRHQMRGASNFWTDIVKKYFTLTFPKTTLWSLILCTVHGICPHCWVGRVWESAGGGLAGGSAPMTSKQKVQKERFWAKNPSSMTCACVHQGVMQQWNSLLKHNWFLLEVGTSSGWFDLQCTLTGKLNPPNGNVWLDV